MDHQKKCPKCSETKPRTEFRRNRSKPDGLQSQCRPCQSATCTAWVRANPERHRGFVAKQTARDARRAHRYKRAFSYFRGRPGWTSSLTACLLREKRLHAMSWLVPALNEFVAEAV